MGIIEELGIKPIEAESFYADVYARVSKPYCPLKPVRELEQQRNKLLEALIEDWKTIECFLVVEADSIQTEWYNLLVERQGEIQNIIEKADPQHRPWSKIKELI